MRRSSVVTAFDPAPVADLIAEGCYRCLEEALSTAQPSAPRSEPARACAFDAALLLAARDRQLGTLAADHLPVARTLASATSRDLLLLAVVEALPWPQAALGPAGRDEALMAWQKLAPEVRRWHAALSALPPADLAGQYVLAGLTCTWPFVVPDSTNAGARADSPGARGDDAADPLLLRFGRMLCSRPQFDDVLSFQASHPRFEETQLIAADAAMNGGALLTAERHYTAALEAFPAMLPAVHGLARLHVMLEEYEASLPEYQAILAVVPDQQDCLLGKARALSQLGRYAEALPLLDRLIALGTWLVGDARYWRGWNHLQTGETEDASADAEVALQLMVNARVHVLAGAVAGRKEDWRRARAEFEAALPLDETDCDIPMSLGSVLGQQRDWSPAFTAYAAAAGCYVRSEAEASRRLAEVSSAPLDHARRERLIARARDTVTAAHRAQGQARYNAAVSLASQARLEEARVWATEALAWPEWQERAQKLLDTAR